MSAGLYNFEIEQGATFSRTFEVFDTFIADGDVGNVESNLTGWSARLQVRKKPQSSTTLLSLTMGSGLSIPTPANGTILMELTSVQTAALDFNCASYDLELFVTGSSPAVVDKLIRGEVTLIRESTR